jgi:aspartate 1-decarboxylase
MMFRKLLQGKIHRATVTDGDLEYEGSITVDDTLIQAAGMVPHEAVDIYNVTNGNRFETYIIPAPADSGIIQVNGAACHLTGKGDLIIIASYGFYDLKELAYHEPNVILVDARNRIKSLQPCC